MQSKRLATVSIATLHLLIANRSLSLKGLLRASDLLRHVEELVRVLVHVARQGVTSKSAVSPIRRYLERRAVLSFEPRK